MEAECGCQHTTWKNLYDDLAGPRTTILVLRTVRQAAPHLREFLRGPRSPLSYRAAAGFYERFRASSLKKEPGFLEDVQRHVERMAAQPVRDHWPNKTAT